MEAGNPDNMAACSASRWRLGAAGGAGFGERDPLNRKAIRTSMPRRCAYLSRGIDRGRRARPLKGAGFQVMADAGSGRPSIDDYWSSRTRLMWARSEGAGLQPSRCAGPRQARIRSTRRDSLNIVVPRAGLTAWSAALTLYLSGILEAPAGDTLPAGGQRSFSFGWVPSGSCRSTLLVHSGCRRFSRAPDQHHVAGKVLRIPRIFRVVAEQDPGDPVSTGVQLAPLLFTGSAPPQLGLTVPFLRCRQHRITGPPLSFAQVLGGVRDGLDIAHHPAVILPAVRAGIASFKAWIS